MSQPAEVPQVPQVTLSGGTQMPVIGLGTWKLSGYQAESGVAAALATGYRHLDTAVMYGNESEIGSALAASGLSRDEIFITTKIRPSDLGHETAVLRRSLRALRTEYVDLWLVHWPPNNQQQLRQIWNELRRLRDEGLARAIGVSNYDLAQIDDLAQASGEAPAVNQVRWSPSQHDPAVLAGHAERGVVLEGYSPLKDTRLGAPAITAAADAHGVTPAQVVLRWHLEHGIPVIPKSSRPERMAANLDLLGFSLTPDEVAAIDAIGG